MEEEEEEHEEQDYEQEEAEEVCNMKKTDHEKREGEEGSLARSLYSKKHLYILCTDHFSPSLSLSHVFFYPNHHVLGLRSGERVPRFPASSLPCLNHHLHAHTPHAVRDPIGSST